MDPREMDALVQRLVHNPHDQDAILYAHSSGQSDPRSYAMLLEKVGTATSDPALASHWLTESANVWVTSLNDAHRAARALMIAIDRDPTQPAPAEKLAELYREKGDSKALAALLERRAKALAPHAGQDANMRAYVASIHEELGRLWSEPPLSNLNKAIENYRKAIEFEPNSIYAIYAVREAYKAAGQAQEAIPYFAMEQALVEDTERKLALYQDEAEVRRGMGDFAGAVTALQHARSLDPADPALKQQLASLVLDRVREGGAPDANQRSLGAALFVELAEQYPGEHALAYSTCALEIEPTNDRAVQLAMYYASQLGRQSEVAPYAAAYEKQNPRGALAAEAKQFAGGAAPRPSDATQVTSPPTDDTFEEVESIEGPSLEPADLDRASELVEKAQQLVKKSRKNEAAGVFQEVLKLDPTHPDALGFLQTYLRQTRRYAALRDILLSASGASADSPDTQLSYLREAAGLCESQLRDFNTAISAWQKVIDIDPGDSEARDQLRRLLERAGRWDDLADLLQKEAEDTADLEARIALEKQLAKLHETKRKDPVLAGEAWARIAGLTPDDDGAIMTAVKFFEKGKRPELAGQVIADTVANVEDEKARGELYQKLGAIREAAGEVVGAGEAFAEGAASTRDSRLYESAERCFVSAEAWGQAATAVNEQAQMSDSPKAKAGLFAKEADYLLRAGDPDSAIVRFEEAADLDPVNEEYAQALDEQLTAANRLDDLAGFLLRRADKLPDPETRVSLRKRAAAMQRENLGDAEAARESLELVLADAEDTEALSLLADDADERGEPGEAADYLGRLAKVVDSDADRVQVMLRQARVLSEGLDEVDGAVELYERVLEELDPKNEEALTKIAELEERRDNAEGTAQALERLVKVVGAKEQKVDIARRLADLYENKIDNATEALRCLNIVHQADPDDFEAVSRIMELAERLGQWDTVAEHLKMLIEVEGEEEELSGMTRRLADILSEKLDRGDEALAELAKVADLGDAACRDEYIRLGDLLGHKGGVAKKLVEWYREAPQSEERNERLADAFNRFVEVGDDESAASVAKDLSRMRALEASMAEPLEQVAARLRDLDALSMAHELLIRDLSGPSRAEEMVRQAEVLVSAGVDPLEAIQHGEQALTSVSPEEVQPLLERLAALAAAPGHVIDLYERQITRCKSPVDRLEALARAAQVAAERDTFDRARSFFDVALSGGVKEDTLDALERVARETDEQKEGTTLRNTLAEALAAGGQGSRDGGRTRSAMLRRAALMVYRELDDNERAFTWLGDALITHVDDAGLDALEELAQSVGDPSRAEAVLGRALDEVFDGPLVRKLLARRAAVRDDRLGDKRGAAEDLKRLHDLAPSDTDVMEKLSGLYTELEDYRGMVQLYEDQILRGRDQSSRADLARKVARLWENELDDPREAADAWRRVLRMKSGDEEAKDGLERAKQNMLSRKSEPESEAVSQSQASAPAVAPLEAPTEPSAEAAPLVDGPPEPGAQAAAEPSEAAPGDEEEEEQERTPVPEASAAADVAEPADQEPAEQEEAAAPIEAPTVATEEADRATPSSPIAAHAGLDELRASDASTDEQGESEPEVTEPMPKDAGIDAPTQPSAGLFTEQEAPAPAEPERAAPPPPPLPPPPGASQPPPPPSMRSSGPPPPPPSMSGSRPPPPPRTSRPPPPPPPGARRSASLPPPPPPPGARASGRPPPPPSIAAKAAAGGNSGGAAAPPPPLGALRGNGDATLAAAPGADEEEDIEVVEDDELFED